MSEIVHSNIFSRISDYAYKNKNFLLLTFLLPPLAWLGIVYLGSLLILLMHSFFYLDGFTGQIVYEFSFSTLIELFSQRANIDIIIRTVMMAFSVTLGATIIGLPVAYYMAKFTTKKTKAIFYLAVMLPLWSSYLVRVYAWKLILAKEGIINWTFAKLHLTWFIDYILSLPVIGGPSLSISYIGMFLVFTFIWLPFMIIPIQASLERVPNSLLDASSDLGAPPRKAFYKIILPKGYRIYLFLYLGQFYYFHLDFLLIIGNLLSIKNPQIYEKIIVCDSNSCKMYRLQPKCMKNHRM